MFERKSPRNGLRFAPLDADLARAVTEWPSKAGTKATETTWSTRGVAVVRMPLHSL